MRRAQASHAFLYVLTIVIFALILIFGYKMVKSFKDKSDDLLMLKFERDLQATLHSVSYGTAKVRTFDVPSGYRQFWLADLNTAKDPNGDLVPPCAGINVPAEVRDALESGVRKNAFLVGDGDFHAFFLEQVRIGSGCVSADIRNNALELRLSKG